jgi:hypothetical protein
VIAFIGRALLDLLCAMTRPTPPIPDLPPIQPRPEPPGVELCSVCHESPARAGTGFCGDACQATWVAKRNHAIPLPAPPLTLPDGSQPRRTT